MNDEPIDWEKEKRIKAEKEKAEMSMTGESKANLANIDSSAFKNKRGFSSDPDAFYKTGEKFANIGIALAVLGAVGKLATGMILTGALFGGNGGEKRAENSAVATATGIIGSIFFIMLLIALILGTCGIIAGIIYRIKTGKNSWHIIIAGVASVAIAVLLTIL